MTDHPSKEIIGTKGKELGGKRIVLCVTGSVAVVESPGIARILMRHGAEVYPVMTRAAHEIIHPYLMEWATGNSVVTELTGKIEHVALAGDHSQKSDLILVAPATANTISKIACGIDDSTVTSVVSSAFGSRIPIVIVPAMHESMYNHPIVAENIQKLKALGVDFVGPRIEEGKAKIAETVEIADAVIRRLTVVPDFQGLRVLITAGPTIEHIDPIRVMTNRSSGKMGVALAEEALSRGAEVALIYGPGVASPPPEAKIIRIETTNEMHNAVMSELKTEKYDIVIAAAAAADWAPEKPYPYKMSTHKLKELELKLKPTRKIIDSVRRASSESFIVAFRAEYNLPKQRLIESAHQRLLEANADLIVVNDIGKKGAGFATETNEVFIVDKEGAVAHVPLTTKREVAARILDTIHKRLAKQNCRRNDVEK